MLKRFPKKTQKILISPLDSWQLQRFLLMSLRTSKKNEPLHLWLCFEPFARVSQNDNITPDKRHQTDGK